jgi:Holliday junction resolvase-like predicted endonuclease
MASAILDFWTYDMVATVERLQRNERGLQPHLLERPVLKFGATLVQLPWVVGVQNNSTAAINNLRRLGARRGQARDEARRVEAGLAGLLERRGFRTLLNWVPPRDVEDAGEVDLIASLDGHLFVIEVKSTFMRLSQREAWLHATTTLRKAGQQLRRKAEAVSLAIAYAAVRRFSEGSPSKS